MSTKKEVSGKGPAPVQDGDAALQYVNVGETIEMTPEDEKRLLRKIDRRIVPLMFGCYFLQYLDKTLINYANVMGLRKDTGITGDQYSELATVFYVTYLAFEFPTAYLMQRLPTAKFLGVNVLLWGLMVTCNSTSHNWAGLVSLRVLLGCFEASVAPALILITTMWYKKSEQPPRVGFWYVGTGVAKIVGALTSFGFQHYTRNDFKSWQVMFLVWGLATITVGALVLLLMPDNPMTARLSEQEKRWAIERLRTNLTGVENKHFKLPQFLECLADPQTYLLVLMVLTSNIPNGFISSYQATVIQSFGWTSKQTALLSMPSGAIAIACTLGATWFAGRFGLRGPGIIALLGIGFAGSCLMAFLPSEGYVAGKMVGNYLANFIGSSLPLMYSYAGANYAGHTKKVTMNAIVLISFCAGNIIGPLTFRDEDAPEYIPAKIVMVVTTASAAVLTGILMLYYRWENKRRDRLYAGEVHTENSEFFDLTDRENHEFRYVF
ncbi:allantoin permease [Apiospora marii]|uniref:Allantoin permease n=1 Tax=Apiospora marii TaxID=335849 RepID=A0ABR1S7X7_9PEZI